MSFGSASVQAFEEADLAAKKLEQTYKSTGGTVGLTLEEIQNSVNDLEMLTGIDGDEITDKITAPLLTFKSIQGEVFKDAQKASLDLATFMKSDFQSASIQLGKALEDPIKGIAALRKNGISFSKDQQKVIKSLVETGQKAKAQAMILDEVNTQVGGQAEAQAKPIQKLMTMVGNAMEKVGGFIVGIMEQLAPIGVWLVQNFSKAWDVIMEAIQPVTDAIGRLFSSFEGGSVIMDYFKKYMGAAAGVLKGAGMILGWLIDTVSSYYKWIFSAADGTGVFSKALEFGKKILFGFLDVLRDLPAYLAGIGAGAKQLFNNFKNLDFSTSVGDAFKKAFDETKKGVKKINSESEKAKLPGGGASGPTEAELKAAEEKRKKQQAANKKAADEKKAAEKKAADEAIKALEDHEKKVQKILEDSAKKQNEIGKSELQQKIDDTRDKFAEEIRIAEEYSKSKDEKISKPAHERLKALMNAQDAEIYNLRAEFLLKEQNQIKENAAELSLENLSENEKEIQQIRDKYQKQIDEAKRLEEDLADATQEQKTIAFENWLTLIDQQDTAVQAKLKEQAEKAAKAQKEISDKANADYNEGLKTLSDISLKVGDDLYTALNDQYNKMIALAQQHGLDTYQLEVEYQRKKKDLEKASNEAKLVATGEALGKLGDALGEFTNEQSKQGHDWVVLQRGLALAQIAIDTSRAISSLVAASSANPTNAVTFGAAGLAQFVAGLATILANIASAKKLLSTPIPQAFDGGYKDVTGAQDGKRYRARYLGERKTGMLPPTPSLVLASERGPEYYVSNKSLRNPKVANLVRMIENTERRRTTQMAEGGYYNQEAGAGGSVIPMNLDTNIMLLGAINTLNSILSRGITAELSDGTLIDGNKRLNNLDKSSGGRILNNNAA